jgi:segregation and condensation protein A
MTDDFELSAAVRAVDLVVALDGFEGPIDLLLMLAREQKVDLSQIAILPLAEQYLAFIDTAQKLRLEIAADYLVMAAWLIYLKSRLVVPPPKQKEDPSEAALMTDALRFQLQRREVMQQAARLLGERPYQGVDVFVRGSPDEINGGEEPLGQLNLEDLLMALAARKRGSSEPENYVVAERRLYSIEESAVRLRELLGALLDWGALRKLLPETIGQEAALEERSALASTFAASLELVKSGELEIRQDTPFAPIYLRRCSRPMPLLTSPIGADQ